jgi:hypothetical protein
MGLLFRYSDSFNWYSVEYHENKLKLSAMVGGEIEGIYKFEICRGVC